MLRPFFCFLLLLLWLPALPVRAQTPGAPPATPPPADLPAPKAAGFPIRGRITDDKGEALPFANVFIKTTGQNTTANEQGRYQTVNLKPGTYEVVYQYVGYRARIETVTIAAQAVTLDMALAENTYDLGEVTVRASDEDPAFPIMREAIARRRYYKGEVAAYRCQTYIKGLARLTDVPGKMLGGLIDLTPDMKPGIIYLSESVSELTFRQPGRVQERMISSRVSGNTKGMSFNRAAGLNFDFYDNLVQSGFSERGVVSPIAAGAMTFYRYRLVGATVGQGGKLVNKIEVTPRHKRDPAFRGFIYVQDDTWRLTEVDLRLDSDAGIEYVDEMRISQVMSPVGKDLRVWRPLSQKISVQFKAFGFKGNGSFTTVYSQYDVRPAYPAEAKPENVQPTKEEEKAVAATASQPAKSGTRGTKPAKPKRVKPPKAAVVPRDSLFAGEIPLRAGEVMRVEAEANQRDSSYWTSMRPIPLTLEEQRDYVQKDSVETVKNSRRYRDSLDRISNRPSVSDLLLSGYEYQRSFERRTISVPSVLQMLQYNTVEGTVFYAPISFRQRYEDRRYWLLVPTLRYGLEDHRFKGTIRLDRRYDPIREGQWVVEGGRAVDDLNATSPITPIINSYYTLVSNRNYLKLYQRDYGFGHWEAEVVNGLRLGATLGYADRRELVNTTDKVWRDIKGRALTPNNPFAPTPLIDGKADRDAYFGLTGPRLFNRSRIGQVDFFARWQPGQEFIQRPTRRVRLGGTLPALTARIRGGAGENDTHFAALSLMADDEIDAGLVGRLEWRAEAGFFPSKQNVVYLDYQHFRGNLTRLASFGQPGFQLLPYYDYSTTGAWLEGHASHHFNGFLLNKIPGLRKLKWQEVATANYLHTAALGHYLEAGFGIEHIFKAMRVDFYTGYRLREGAGKVSSGLRIGAGF